MSILLPVKEWTLGAFGRAYRRFCDIATEAEEIEQVSRKTGEEYRT
jgi:hypothetical protein